MAPPFSFPAGPFDVIIVGGGSAGSVLAGRLSADPALSVLLIEAGPDLTPDTAPPEILDASDASGPLRSGARFMWPDFYTTRHADQPPGRYYEQARILGGGSSINMQAANRGVPSDYDDWAARGAEGWHWEAVLPYFRKLETDTTFGEGPLHGGSGPIPISHDRLEHWSGFNRAVSAVLADHGLPFLEDQNGDFRTGHFRMAQSHDGQQRSSAAFGYLDATVRARANLTLLTDTTVSALLVEGGAVRGVDIGTPAAPRPLAARRVILAAGALHTPVLLLRAGIGPADELRALGIAPVADRPGVGRGLWEHASIALVSPVAGGQWPQGWRRSGVGARFSSGLPGADPADLFAVITASPEGMMAGLWINRPDSVGRVALSGPGLADRPLRDLNLLADPRDIDRLRIGLRRLAAVLGDARLAPFGLAPQLYRFGVPEGGISAPLAELLADDAALVRHLRYNVSGVWHACGTARMGRAEDPLAVVDPEGRVYGVAGLWVGDASVFPGVPSANINLPTLMAAEKLADAFLARHALAPASAALPA